MDKNQGESMGRFQYNWNVLKCVLKRSSGHFILLEINDFKYSVHLSLYWLFSSGRDLLVHW